MLSTSPSPRARRSASSGRTAPARPRCSVLPPARVRATPVASSSPAALSHLSPPGGAPRGRGFYPPCVELLDQCGLAKKANRRAGSLTLLDRKRLELARALAT